jgi:hypothetical protein
MFATYMTVQRQQQHLEKQMKRKDKEARLLRNQHGRRAVAADELPFISNDATAELQLHSDSDDDSGDVEENNMAAAIEQSVVAARNMQLSRGRRSNIQDALIHRFLFKV